MLVLNHLGRICYLLPRVCSPVHLLSGAFYSYLIT
nr:MAG TPA: hypothetical protein [Caudoviricetes sp.]